VLKHRSGQFQPVVNGGTSTVFDPGDATVKWFFKNDSLFLGFDVNDESVTEQSVVDRWDGFIVSINDRVIRGNDQTLRSRRLARPRTGRTACSPCRTAAGWHSRSNRAPR
jgi:hypothetical protein